MIKLTLESKRDRQTETVIKGFLNRIQRCRDGEELEYFLICKVSDSYDDVDVNELMKVALESGYGYIDSNDWFTFMKFKTFGGIMAFCRNVKIYYEDGAILQCRDSYNCSDVHPNLKI